MSINLEKTLVVYNSEIEGAKDFALLVVQKLQNSSIISISDINKTQKPTLVVVIGGDGSYLRCAREFSEDEVPIFGFNMGHLGFLVQAKPNELSNATEQILSGKFKIENRMMLETVLGGKKYLALNDFVVKGKTFSRTSVYELYINDNFVSRYLADGLIISTPTGSTAYTLSAGGPVISPDLASIAIVPICPHTLNARPIVVGANEKIRIKCADCNTAEYKLTADGQEEVIANSEIEIARSKTNAKILLLSESENNFYTILREKFGWGVAPKKW